MASVSPDEEQPTPPIEGQEDAVPREEPPALPSWVLSPGHVVLAVLWGLFFMVLNTLPLGTGGLWGHVLYGEQILEDRALPTEDPFMPLAAGVQVLDDVWLTQVVLAAVEHAGGMEWLSHLFALTVLATYLLLARACYLVSGSPWWSALGTVVALLLAGGRATGFRAETFGALCFAILLWLIAGSGALGRGGEKESGEVARPWRLWLGVPLLFVLWVNLHGSWVFGLMLLGLFAAGQATETGWRGRSVRAALEDADARRWLYLAELAFLACLVNPYGFDLVLDAFGVSVTGNPRALASPSQVAINGGPGVALVVSWLAVGVFLARGHRLPGSLLVAWLGFAALGATGVQKLTWYGPLFALALMPLVSAAWKARRSAATVPLLTGTRPGCFGRSVWATMLAVVVAFGALVFSPLGASQIAGVTRTTGQILGPGAPLALTAYLQANPPRGRIFNSQSLGDWLVYEGPPGLEPFITSKLDLIPIRVWLDYQRATQAGYEWERIFDRYRIDTVILDTAGQRLLSRAVRFTDGWSLVFEDDRTAVYVRDSAYRVDPGVGAPAEETGPSTESSPAAGESGNRNGNDREDDAS